MRSSTMIWENVGKRNIYIYYLVFNTPDLINTKTFKVASNSGFIDLKDMLEFSGSGAERKASELAGRVINRMFELALKDMREERSIFQLGNIFTMHADETNDQVDYDTFGSGEKFDFETLGKMFGIKIMLNKNVWMVSKNRYYVKLNKKQQALLNNKMMEDSI